MLALLAYAVGRIDEALEHLRRSVRIDDTNATQYSVLSLFLRSSGDYREAIEAADAGLDLVDTGAIRVRLFIHKIEALKALGEIPKANEVMDEAIASAGSEWKFILVGTFASLGRREEAEQLLSALERLDQPPTYLMAQTYAQFGDDRAFEWIRSGIDDHILGVVCCLREHPDCSMLRQDPRWAKMMSHLEAEETKGSAGQNRQG